MRQKYSAATLQPVMHNLETELQSLKGLPVLKWYRGMAHTLHFHFGKPNQEIVKRRSEEIERVSGDYSLFFHGEWEIKNNGATISSLQSKSEEIDTFIQAHHLQSCLDINMDQDKLILTITFADGSTLTAFDRDHSWFVFEKFGRFSYSPKTDGQVEVSEILLE